MYGSGYTGGDTSTFKGTWTCTAVVNKVGDATVYNRIFRTIISDATFKYETEDNGVADAPYTETITSFTISGGVATLGYGVAGKSWQFTIVNGMLVYYPQYTKQ